MTWGEERCEPMLPHQHGRTHQFSKRTFHSLRYSFDLALANAGVSQEIRVKFTGHSSNAMNDRYTKLDRKPLGDAIEKLPKLDES